MPAKSEPNPYMMTAKEYKRWINTLDEPNDPYCQPEKGALSFQEGGSHYKGLGIQPIEFITSNNMTFSQGNAIKYLYRYKDKNGIEDLKKAKHYIDLIIELEYPNG